MASPENDKKDNFQNSVGDSDKRKKTLNILKITSIVLAGLIVLSLLGLIAVQIYKHFIDKPEPEPGYVQVPIEILTPSKEKEPPHFSGRVLDNDGNPLDGYCLNIKPFDRTVNITSGGYFIFDNLGTGDYLITLADGSGKIITDIKINISLSDIAGISVTQNADGSFNISLAKDIRLEEVVIVYNKNTKKLLFDTYKVSYLTSGGLVATPAGTAKTSEGVIITPAGNICLDDKRVILPIVESDGSRWIIMPDDILKKFSPGSYDGITIENDGTVILPDGTKVLPNGIIRNPTGEEKTQGESGVIITNGIVTYIGEKPPIPEVRDLPHLTGRLLADNGSSLPLNYKLIYKEFSEEALIGSQGYFLIANFKEGNHTLQLLDGDGKTVTELKITIVKSSIDGMSLSGNSSAGYTLTIGQDIRISELIFTFNSNANTISIDLEKTTYVKSSGYVKTPAGSATRQQGVIVTPAGNILLEDGTILLPVVAQNGGRWSIGTDNKLVLLAPGTYSGVVIGTDGKITLTDSTVIDKDGKITAPGKDPVTQGETGVIIKDKTVTPIGGNTPTEPEVTPRDLPHLTGRLLGKDGNPLSAKLVWEEANVATASKIPGYSLLSSTNNIIPKLLNLNYSGDNLSKFIQKTSITALANNNGYFMLDNINTGEHTLSVVDNNGNSLAKVKADIRITSASGVVVTGNPTDGYIISIGTDIRLIELVFIFDKDTGKLSIDTSRITFITTSGYVKTPAGNTTNKNGVIVTPSGNILLDDGTIILPVVGASGGRYVITPNNELIYLEPGNHGNFIIGSNGLVTLYDGTTIDKDGRITPPGKTSVSPGETGVIIKDKTVTPIGYTPPPPPPPPPVTEAKAEIIVLTGKKSGTGDIMDADTSPFVAEDMYPGDRITKYYCLDVTPNGSVSMRFFITLKDQNAKLGEVLKVKVTLWEKGSGDSYVEAGIVYDGLMRDMQSSITSSTASYKQVTAANGVKVQYFYEVTVYLDKSVGNEYANQTLNADFRWELLR